MDGLLELVLLLAIAAAAWLLLKPALPALLARIGNWRVHLALRRALPPSHYRLFRDLALRPEAPGEAATPTADHVVVSPYGIFVIVTVHLSGRISGNPGAVQWTCARWRAERPFRNPLLRNQERVRALRQRLRLDPSCFHPLVVFTGRAELAPKLPANVTPIGGLLPFVQVRTHAALGFEEAERIAGLLEAGRLPRAVQTAAAQLAGLRRTHGTRFGARQAMLGLSLMAALLIAAGSLVQRLAEMPGQYPAREAATPASPFVDHSPPPRIDLPGVARSEQVAPASSAVTGIVPGVDAFELARQAQGSLAALDERLAREASLKCGYATESRRCACYGPEGRRAALDYDSCKALADRMSGTPLD